MILRTFLFASTIVAALGLQSSTSKPHYSTSKLLQRRIFSVPAILASVDDVQANIPIRRKSSLNLDPIKSKCLSSLLGFTLSEVLTQILFKKAHFNLAKILVMASYGAAVHGPAGHFFYGYLNKAIPKSTGTDIVKKVLVDQLLYTPVLQSVLVFYFGALFGMSPKKIIKLGATCLPRLILGSWIIWPFSHFINFKFIKPKYRLVFVNLVQIVSNVVCSLILNVKILQF